MRLSKLKDAFEPSFEDCSEVFWLCSSEFKNAQSDVHVGTMTFGYFNEHEVLMKLVTAAGGCSAKAPLSC